MKLAWLHPGNLLAQRLACRFAFLARSFEAVTQQPVGHVVIIEHGFRDKTIMHRLSLGLEAVEQAWAAPPLEARGKFPAEIDRIAQAGKTFKYTENGPVGLAGGKRVLIASSRGGAYSTTAALQALDHQEAYLRTVFGFLGITDVTVIRAEGLAMGDAARTAAFAQAQTQIDELAIPIAA